MVAVGGLIRQNRKLEGQLRKLSES
jgi:hypothetical protein